MPSDPRSRFGAALFTGVILAAACQQPPSPSPTARAQHALVGSWEPVADTLYQGRSGPLVTLPNGDVLLVAGSTGAGASRYRGRYVALTNSWQDGDALQARERHAVSLLLDGKVLVTGGRNSGDDPEPDTHLIDPDSGTFSWANNLWPARKGHTSTTLADGRVLIAGGASLSKLYLPETGAFADAGYLPDARQDLTATRLADGSVLVVGGAVGAETKASAHRFDPTSITWTSAGSLAQARTEHTATLLADGRVLVVGGWSGTWLGSAELYDPAANSWSPTGAMLAARATHIAVRLPDGRVLVSGGMSGEPLATSELYDPATGLWSAATSMPEPRYRHGAALLANGKVLVVGGMNDFGALATSLLYDTGAPGTCTLCQGDGSCLSLVTGSSCGTCQACDAPGGACVVMAPGSSCGLCLTCDATAACVPAADDDACEVLNCDYYDDTCRDYQDIADARCAPEGGRCLYVSPLACDRWTDVPAGGSCGLCLACDGMGECVAADDDAACGTIGCDAFDQPCRDYHDLTAGRCLPDHTCKTSSLEACASWTDRPAGEGCGLCAACDGAGACTGAVDDDACGTIDCDVFDAPCRDFTDLTAARCAALGTCKTTSLEACWAYADSDAGTRCGVCMGCDGAGRCDLPRADDEACGHVDCDGFDTACRDYGELTSGRCTPEGQCRGANDPAACVGYADLAGGTTCGVCQVCDGEGGCSSAPDGTSCEGAFLCSRGDLCRDGVCVAGVNACYDGNPCTADDCGEASTGCTHAPLDGEPCSTATRCGGVCLDDVCSGGVTIACDDGNPCTEDGCEASTVECVHTAVPDGTACGEGSCLSGVCSLADAGAPDATRDDSGPSDADDAGGGCQVGGRPGNTSVMLLVLLFAAVTRRKR